MASETEIAAILRDAPRRIPYEIIDEKDVVVKRGKTPKTKIILLWRRVKPNPRAYVMTHIIAVPGSITLTEKKFLFFKYTKKKTVKPTFLVRWNLFWGEALKQGQTVPNYSVPLESLLKADFMTQGLNGVAKMNGIDFDILMKLSAIVFFIGIPFGIIMDTLLNVIPTVIVNWVP